jgi:glycosyltransferase involved in cell wall biosynthesis
MGRPIAFVLPSFAGGGAERVMLTLIGALDRDRFAPALVVLRGAGPLIDMVPAGVPVHDLARPRLRAALAPLVRCLRRLRPAVEVSTFGHVNLALLGLRPVLPAGTRLLTREANTPSQSLPQAPWPVMTALAYRLLYPTADGVLCQHDRTAHEMAARFRVAPDRIYPLCNPVDIARLRAAAARPVRALGAGLRFVVAGRLTRQKGVDRLLPLLGHGPSDTHLTVLGDGPERARLEAAARSLGIAERVRFTGFVAKPWPWLAGADACLVPSRWEGMPNVALEALACGTPVIASPEAGGIDELAAETAAVTVAGTRDAFAAAMAALAPAPVAAPRPARLPERFALESVSRRFEQILDAI